MPSVKLPDVAGKTLYFPTLQNCEVGQTDWSQLPAEGQDPHSLKAPAPSVTVTAAAAADGHAAHAASTSDTTPETVQAAAVNDDGAQARELGRAGGRRGRPRPGGLALVRSRSNKPVPVRAPAPGSAPKE